MFMSISIREMRSELSLSTLRMAKMNKLQTTLNFWESVEISCIASGE